MQVNDIFTSIDGEVNAWGQGTFSTFIRFQQCNLRCTYCDTKQAQGTKGGVELSIEQLIGVCKDQGTSKVTLTGGEPLLQSKKQMEILIWRLMHEGFKVSLETNGTQVIPFPLARANFSVIMDYKLEYENQMILSNNIKNMDTNDYLKFVIDGPEEYEQAKKIAQDIHAFNDRLNIVFSPVFRKVNPANLINEIKKDRLFYIGINIQLHKIIFGDENEAKSVLS